MTQFRIITKNRSDSGSIPPTASLQVGELAVNTGDGGLYYLHNSGTLSGSVSLIRAGQAATASIATSASFATTASFAVSASWAPNVGGGSGLFASSSVSASWASSSISSSYAATASLLLGSVVSASYAGTASVLLGSIISASYALTSSYALNGGTGGGTTVIGAIREIGNTITSASQTTVTFDGIPSIYRDLIIRVAGRGTNASNSVGLTLRFNNDSGSNYSYRYWNVFGTGQAVNDVYLNAGELVGSTTPADFASLIDIDIIGYTSSFKKTVRSDLAFRFGNASTETIPEVGAGTWNNTGSISTITISLTAGAFVNGTTITLYGMGGVGGELITSASFATSASWAPSTGGGSGLFASSSVSASWASSSISSSYAATASLLLGSIVSASYALTASYALNGGGSPILSNTIGAAVWRSGSQTINGTQAVSFTTEYRDDSGFWSISPNPTRITIPSGAEGWYVVAGNAYWNGVTGLGRRGLIYLNGVEVAGQSAVADADHNDVRNSATVVRYLNVGDYLEWFMSENFGGTVDIFASASLSAVRIGGTVSASYAETSSYALNGGTTTNNYTNSYTLLGGSLRTSSSVNIAGITSGSTVTGSIVLANGFIVYQLSTSDIARVRLYSSASYRNSDVTRSINQTPTGEHGLIFDVVTSGNVNFLNYDLAPMPFGADLSSTPNGQIAYSITNLTAGTVNLTSSVVFVPLETTASNSSISASYAATASYALNGDSSLSSSWASSSISSSFAISASWAPNTGGGSGLFASSSVSASWASSSISASYAGTASILLGSVQSASYTATASYLEGFADGPMSGTFSGSGAQIFNLNWDNIVNKPSGLVSGSNTISITFSASLSPSYSIISSGTQHFVDGTYNLRGVLNDTTFRDYRVAGMFTWYSGTVDQLQDDEIVLHRMGRNASSASIFMRTLATIGSGTVFLQIGSDFVTPSSSYTFTFSRIL